MDVSPAETDWELEQARRLFRSFVAWHRERHTEDLDLIDAYFDEESWQAELDGLPGAYAPPDGCLLVCLEAELAVGCGAFQRLGEDSCEMKRLFVTPVARGRGAGRALVEELVSRARAAGYRWMYLDTSVRQAEAIALYRDLGFVPTDAYHDVPEELRDWLVFFRLAL